MYQLTELAGDQDRERLAHAERRMRRAAPGPAAARPSSRPPPTSDRAPATAGHLNPNDHQEVTMNRTRPFAPIRRLAGILAALATALLATAAAAPAAFAKPVPLAPGRDATGPPPPVHTVIVGGMPGWQIALIAIAAAVAASVAVLLDRARAARRHQPAPSA